MGNFSEGNIKFQRISVLGLGYIGLPTAIQFALRGCTVSGFDIDASRVEKVNRGEFPFVEPNSRELLSRAIEQKSLRASTELSPADAYIISVPTPIKLNRLPDMSHVWDAIDRIAPLLSGGELVVIESTCPPGSTEDAALRLSSARPDLSFDSGSEACVKVAYCPERVIPGKTMYEVVENDRTVGGFTEQASEAAAELYSIFCRGQVSKTTAATAEIVKLAENSFRDVNIAFANELSLICDKLGANVWDVIELANRHPRVDILKPGPGVGGHCIAVDPWFLVGLAPEQSQLIRKARQVNDSKPTFVVQDVVKETRNLQNPEFAILGVTFKANIEDTRQSPALAIAVEIARKFPQSRVNIIEPNLAKLPVPLDSMGNVELASMKAALSQSDVIVGLVDHDEFKDISSVDIAGKRIVDAKGIFRPKL